MAKNGLLKKSLWWVNINHVNAVVSGSKFTELFAFNAGGITVNNVLFRFWISLSVPEIFVVNVRRCPILCQI